MAQTLYQHGSSTVVVAGGAFFTILTYFSPAGGKKILLSRGTQLDSEWVVLSLIAPCVVVLVIAVIHVDGN